jgi:signal transduction histidine kinase
MIRSLRFRLAVGAFVAIALSLMTVWASLSRLFIDYVVGSYREEMTVLSDSLAAGVVVKDGKLVLTSSPSDPRLSLPASGRYWQFEAEGQAAERSRSLWDTVISAGSPSSYGAGLFTEATGPDGAKILVLAQKSSLGEGKDAHSFVIRTAFPLAELENALQAYHGQLARMLIVTALVLAAAAFIQAAIGLAPLGRLRREVARIRAGESAGIRDEGPAEVRPLVGEINLLLAERETAVARARARASDLAHGFKTPLTVLSQLAERMEPEAADMALRQVEIIRQRADRQLQAARLGVEQMASTDLGSLIGKLIHVLRPATEARKVTWRLQTDGNLSIQADPADLAEAIGNILDNATKWARSEIAIRAERKGGTILVLVGDDGPGVDASAYATILERGVHADGEEGGSGLGLAISRDIAEAYGGSLTFGKSTLGGLEVRLSFPANPVRRTKSSPA